MNRGFRITLKSLVFESHFHRASRYIIKDEFSWLPNLINLYGNCRRCSPSDLALSKRPRSRIPRYFGNRDCIRFLLGNLAERTQYRLWSGSHGCVCFYGRAEIFHTASSTMLLHMRENHHRNVSTHFPFELATRDYFIKHQRNWSELQPNYQLHLHLK